MKLRASNQPQCSCRSKIKRASLCTMEPFSTFLVQRTASPLNLSGTGDITPSQTFLVPRIPPSQHFWYQGPPPLATFLVPMTPSPLNLSGTGDISPLSILSGTADTPFSTLMVPRTPSPRKLSGTYDPLPSQPFWYRGYLSPLKPFWYRGYPLLNPYGT
jgi:hypothetical protein